MHEHDAYPFLWQLLGAYFHQDAFMDGETTESIMLDYRQTTRAYQRESTRADIQRFLREHEHDQRFLKSLHDTFSSSVVSAASDAEARAWLGQLLQLLDDP